jgi:hypothetical protein
MVLRAEQANGGFHTASGLSQQIEKYHKALRKGFGGAMITA